MLHIIRDTHMDIHDAIIRSSVSEEMPFMDNHIIIIGKACFTIIMLCEMVQVAHLDCKTHCEHKRIQLYVFVLHGYVVHM